MWSGTVDQWDFTPDQNTNTKLKIDFKQPSKRSVLTSRDSQHCSNNKWKRFNAWPFPCRAWLGRCVQVKIYKQGPYWGLNPSQPNQTVFSLLHHTLGTGNNLSRAIFKARMVRRYITAHCCGLMPPMTFWTLGVYTNECSPALCHPLQPAHSLVSLFSKHGLCAPALVWPSFFIKLHLQKSTNFGYHTQMQIRAYCYK